MTGIDLPKPRKLSKAVISKKGCHPEAKRGILRVCIIACLKDLSLRSR